MSACSNALYFSRAPIPFCRDTPGFCEGTAYLRHVGLYAFQRQFVEEFPALPARHLEQAEQLEQLRVLEAGHKIKVVHVEHTFPGVDTEAELAALQGSAVAGAASAAAAPGS